VVCDWAASGETTSAAKTTPAGIIFTEVSPCYSGSHAASNNKTGIALSIFPKFSRFLVLKHARISAPGVTPGARTTKFVQSHELICLRRE
jgi:hypothetical protein